MNLAEFNAWAIEHPDADELVLTPAESVELTNSILDAENAEQYRVDGWPEKAVGVRADRVYRPGPGPKRSVRLVVRT